MVELSCHGGSAVARRLVEACIAAGASPAAPGEYTRRAFLNGKLSLTQAEAVMDIISADGRQGAALANASLNGALARKMAAQKDALTALQAHLAAWVDFPEEDVPELSQSHLCDALGGVEQELDALIQSYDAGAVLREGVDCAIVGKPNAGKSTLLNLLAGFDRAIVTSVAGTTRDVVEQAVQLGDVRLNLFDTGRTWSWLSAARVVRPSRWSIKRTSPPGLTQSSSRPILRWCCRSVVRKRGRGRSSRQR